MIGVHSATAKGLLLGFADDGDGDDAATATAAVIVESPIALSLEVRTRPLFAFFALLPMVYGDSGSLLRGGAIGIETRNWNEALN